MAVIVGRVPRWIVRKTAAAAAQQGQSGTPLPLTHPSLPPPSLLHSRYSAWPYAITRLIIELLVLRVLPAIAFSGVFYSMMGLKPTLSALSNFLIATSLASIDSALLCASIAALAPTRPSATSLLATMILLGYLLLGGFQLNLSAIHDGFVWIADHSFARHAFESTLTTELEDQLVAVDVPGAPKIRIKSEVIMEALGLDPTEEQNAHNILSLIVLGVASAAAHRQQAALPLSTPLTPLPSIHPPCCRRFVATYNCCHHDRPLGVGVY